MRMQKIVFGKLVGALLGYVSFGPVGLLVGVAMGHWFDSGLVGSIEHMHVELTKTRTVFFRSTFEIMGAIAKADGYVSEAEIQSARNVMRHLNLTKDQQAQAIEYFTIGKQPEFDLETALFEFKQYCGRDDNLVRLFLEIQLQSAFSDGRLENPVRRILNQICDALDISTYFIDELTGRSRAEQGFYRHNTSSRRNESSTDYLKDAYGVLGLVPGVSETEVKKAYRRLMMQHHPDKLAAKGLPESMKKIATEKTQQIQKAYETIIKDRGF